MTGVVVNEVKTKIHMYIIYILYIIHYLKLKRMKDNNTNKRKYYNHHTKIWFWTELSDFNWTYYKLD